VCGVILSKPVLQFNWVYPLCVFYCSWFFDFCCLLFVEIFCKQFVADIPPASKRDHNQLTRMSDLLISLCFTCPWVQTFLKIPISWIFPTYTVFVVFSQHLLEKILIFVGRWAMYYPPVKIVEAKNALVSPRVQS